MGRVRGHGGRFLLVIFLFMCLERKVFVGDFSFYVFGDA